MQSGFYAAKTHSCRIQVSVCCWWTKNLLKICSKIQLNFRQTFENTNNGGKLCEANFSELSTDFRYL